MKSYVYVITDGNNYKIGKSTNVEKRLKGLQTGIPQELSIIDKYEVDANMAYPVEKELHKIFDKYKIKNEWFDGRIKKYLPEIKSIIDNIIQTQNQENDFTPKNSIDNGSPYDIVNNLRKKLSTDLMGEKVRAYTTQMLMNGMNRDEAKKHVIDFFSSIYTGAFNDIFESQFDKRYSDSVERCKMLKELLTTK